MTRLWHRILLCSVGVVSLAILVSASAQERPTASQTDGRTYPAPRFPSYLSAPKDVADIMPVARRLVRETQGLQGGGLGVARPGDTVALITNIASEDIYVEAIKRAYQERGITALSMPDYALVGLTREQAQKAREAIRPFTGKDGAAAEIRLWIENMFPKPDETKAWLKANHPEVYAAVYPDKELDATQKELINKMRSTNIGDAIRKFLDQHPEVRGVFWAKAGTTSRRREVHPYENKYLGTFTQDNAATVMSKVASFPGDVWRLIEEKTMEPVGYAEYAEVKDPQGTDLHWEMTEEMAARWAAGVYQQGHLYMHPNQATGRFPYAVLEFPAFQQKYNPREPMPPTNGVVVGTANHAGFYSQTKIHVENSYITKVEGDGLYARLFQVFLHYPGINETKYPYHNKPGFWWFYETAFGTNPKYFRDPGDLMEARNTPERNRSGVIHYGEGIRVHHGPEGPVQSKEWEDFFKEHNLPNDHWWHFHNYFSDYRLRVRGADQFITLIDKGHLTSMDHPEVRALASRYGNPDEVLAEDWIPELPGINAPGKYEDYARNPWESVERTLYKEVPAGTYRYLYPPRKQ